MPELDRRNFLKLVGASATAAATAGCERVQKLVPYVVQPEEITPGIPVFYASTCQECPSGCGLHVKTREGRPVKLEGNPDHPINRGSLCARGQASLSRTYHPDRFPGPMRREEDGSLTRISWDEATQLLADRVREAGSGTYVLGGNTGPTLSGLLDRFVEAVGAGGRVVYQPLELETLREAAQLVYGTPIEPIFDLSRSDLVVSFGTDVIETWRSPLEHARQLMQARDVSKAEGREARFVSVSPRLSLTTDNADEWIPAVPGTEGILALGLARVVVDAGGGPAEDRARLKQLLAGYDAEQVATRTGVEAGTIRRLGGALAGARRPVALPPGVELTSRRATATAAAVLLLNHVLGAVGQSVRLPAERTRGGSRYRATLQLVEAMKSGKVSVLLVHGTDPLYSLPPATGFAEALDQVPFVVSFASSIDETSTRAHLILPDHTTLESWGDARPRPGVRSLVQPTVRPLLDTRALGDTLLATARAVGGPAAERMPAARTFQELLRSAWGDTDFRAALARGGVFEEMSEQPAPPLKASATQLEVAEPLLEGEGGHVLLAYPHPFFYDGRGAFLPHLQELPDPVTRLAWDSWVEMSHATAGKLGVERGDIVRLDTPAGRIEAPASPRGGIRDDVIAVPIGQGHTVGRYASRSQDGERAPRGANVIQALPAATDETGGRAWLTTRARVQATGRFDEVPDGQFSDNNRGRLLGAAVALPVLGEHESPVHKVEHEAAMESHGAEHLVAYDPTEDSNPESPYRWGMTIDTDRCTGCSACSAACYLENNIPVVGEEQMARGREMSWLRIERWVGEGDAKDLPLGNPLPRDREELGGTDVRHAPMLCQQCGDAPCEPVCPVFATYHNDEGLNGMIYNRCVGTRYCSNNCPYKVRRFNYWHYSKLSWPGLLGLMLNPDVTARSKGVMEKCTFCIQRIQSARQTAKDEGRPIADGEVVTACQQACPTQAIVFGNLKDEKSRVVSTADAADSSRRYHALQNLNTRPAITYLAKVTRGRLEG